MKRSVLICAVLVCLRMQAQGHGPGSGTGVSPSHPPPPDSFNLCHSENFPASKGGSPSCCQQGNDVYQIVPVGPLVIDRALGHRQLGIACTSGPPTPGHPPPTNCSQLPTSKPTDPNVCYYGPCGAHIADTWNGNRSAVFHPNSDPGKCGYQSRRGPELLVAIPEPFTNQQQYSEVTASCPYNACLYGGIRAVVFTITVVTSQATGQTSFDPGNITVTGAANFTVARADADSSVTITAVPSGLHAQHTRASFSGACNNSGNGGQTIKCTLSPPFPSSTVTVTYKNQCTGPNCGVNNGPTIH